jgi:hypothetical protein
MSSPWKEKIVALKQEQNYILQKLVGNDGDFGTITVPWKELCTVTYITKGEVVVVNDQGKALCKLGPGRFHYSFIDVETHREKDNTDGCKVSSIDGYLGTYDEMHSVAAQEKIKLVGLGETEFFCLSDPNYQRIWDGNIKSFSDDSEEFKISPEQLQYIIPLDNGISINNEIQKIHKVLHTGIFDKEIILTGKAGLRFMVFKHVGFIEHLK